jgi:hypothetical protein
MEGMAANGSTGTRTEHLRTIRAPRRRPERPTQELLPRPEPAATVTVVVRFERRSGAEPLADLGTMAHLHAELHRLGRHGDDLEVAVRRVRR